MDAGQPKIYVFVAIKQRLTRAYTINLHYFKIYKPKHEAPDLEDDYCEYEDEGPEEIAEEPEDEDTPPWDEDTEEQEARQ